jgi:hypothetical protein
MGDMRRAFGSGEVSVNALNDTADYYDPVNRPLLPFSPGYYRGRPTAHDRALIAAQPSRPADAFLAGAPESGNIEDRRSEWWPTRIPAMVYEGLGSNLYNNALDIAQGVWARGRSMLGYPPPQYPPATGLAAESGFNDIGGESLGSILSNAAKKPTNAGLPLQ